MDATLLLDQHPLPSAAGMTVVRAFLSIAGTAPDMASRVPLGLSLVLDRSGSMGGDPLDAARSAAARAVERLHPNDVVSAVLFDDEIETLAAPARCVDQHQLAQQLRLIEARGSTNLSGGWLRGRQHMEAAAGLLADGCSRRVVLLTDGHANQGIVDQATLVDLARTARAAGITTSTIGVGEHYDDGLLRAMADAGGGNAWYVERPDQAQDVFAEELGNLLNVAAQGLTVTLTLHPDVEMLTVHSDWPTTQQPGMFTFDLGDLYASEPKPLLLELIAPSANTDAPLTAAPATLATLRISAYVLTAGGGLEQRSLSLPIAASLDGQSLMVPDVERAIVLAHAAKAREAAAREQRDGNAEHAAHVMYEAQQLLVASPLYANEAFADELQAESRDLAKMEARYREARFSERDAKYQLQRTHNQRRGKAGYDAKLRRDPNEA
jgi:Ca-activated chloride channel family protein